ncbi:MAG TPA: PIN domain-containing protein [Methylomirabilota bacterium]|nr:PIN domain-containing protein [Methylomirabilota bacterium]
MIAFFDTSVYLDLFAGNLTAAYLSEIFGRYIIRISPIVLHELYRGTRTKKDRRTVDRLASGLLRVQPPSWEEAWIRAGRLLPYLFPDHEAVGLARLQNDLLLALTAHSQGAVFISRDKHFQDIQHILPFYCELV